MVLCNWLREEGWDETQRLTPSPLRACPARWVGKGEGEVGVCSTGLPSNFNLIAEL
jgi:hypothetical protein